MDGSAPTTERAGLVLPDLTIPKIPELERVPWRIDEEDETELRWFMKRPLVASVSTGGGSFGAQLERAKSYGYGALPCRRCGGRWLRVERRMNRESKELEEVVIGWRDGTGRRPKKHFGKRETYAEALARYRVQQAIKLKIVIGTYPNPSESSGVDAGQLWGALLDSYWENGERALMTLDDFREAFPTLPEDWTEPCEPCQGLGVVPRRHPTGARREDINVWPKGSSVGVGGRENLDADGIVGSLERYDRGIFDGAAAVSFTELERYRAMATLLSDVSRISPLARVALELYYAPPDVPLAELLASKDAANAPKWGRQALADVVPARFEPATTPALAKARTARQVEEVYTHACQAFNFAAYGAAS